MLKFKSDSFERGGETKICVETQHLKARCFVHLNSLSTAALRLVPRPHFVACA